MSGSPAPLARSEPQDGDVVVTRGSTSGVRYAVRQHPGALQFSASTRQEAVRLARGFAQTHGVDVWYNEKSLNCLLEAYRRASDGVD